MANVLLVGDDKKRTSEVRSLLALDGHRVAAARDVNRWRAEERSVSPELVVAAVSVPDAVLSVPMAGVRGFAAPILFVNRESDEIGEPQLQERMVDQIVSPFAAEELLGRVDALVRVRRVVMHQREGSGEDAPRRGRQGAVLRALFMRRVPRHVKPVGPYLEVAARVADWSDRRDGIEAGHSERVASFSAMIADEIGLPDGETAALLRAAMLHDMGKVALPVEVLRQRRPLDENQMRLLRTHAERGAAILRALDSDEAVAEAIHYHHERIDGSGYHGRKGGEIPRAARILAVAETFDAMTTTLVRKRVSADGALGLMRELRGASWDGECVDALVEALRPRPSTVQLA